MRNEKENKESRFRHAAMAISLVFCLLFLSVFLPVGRSNAETLRINGRVLNEQRITDTVTIETISGRSVGVATRVQTTDDTPNINGATTIPNAAMSVLLTGNGVSLSSMFTASTTGAWQWTPSQKLKKGSYTFRITATDSNNPNQTATQTITLIIKKEKSLDNGTNGMRPAETLVQPRGLARFPTSPDYREQTTIPGNVEPPSTVGRFRFKASFPNTTGVFEPNSVAAVELSLVPGSFSNLETLFIHYEILDQSGSTLFASDRLQRLANEKILFSLEIPDNLKSGHYSLRITVEKGSNSSIRTIPFEVNDPIILHFGGNTVITASRFNEFYHLMIGTVLFITLLGILLLLRELRIWMGSSREKINETHLFGRKYILTRKEVPK